MTQGLAVPATLDIIDRCQNHVLPGSKVRRHYLLHDFADEKGDVWAKLGRHLEMIVEPGQQATLDSTEELGAVVAV